MRAFPSQLHDAVRDHPYPLLFATVSGADLYGFPSADSDWDMRGVHVLPAREVLGLHALRETVNLDRAEDGVELDLVTHDAYKFFSLMLKRNGYVLEQLLSPLVVHSTPEHAELGDLARGCITRHHAHHYLGFSANQWKLFGQEELPRVKPLLYTFRTLLTGLHLMHTHEVQANLRVLNDEFRLDYLDDLIECKTGGAEHESFMGDLAFFGQEYQRLRDDLAHAKGESSLPGEVTLDTKRALSDLLVRLRLQERNVA